MAYFRPDHHDGVDPKTWDLSESATFTLLPPGEQLDSCRCSVGGSWWMKCYTCFVASALGSLLNWFFLVGVFFLFVCFMGK